MHDFSLNDPIPLPVHFLKIFTEAITSPFDVLTVAFTEEEKVGLVEIPGRIGNSNIGSNSLSIAVNQEIHFHCMLMHYYLTSNILFPTNISPLPHLFPVLM